MSVRDETAAIEPDSHLALCLTIERILLAVRHLGFLIIVPLFVYGYIPGSYSDLAIIIAIVALHSAFAHWVLWTGRHHLFFSRFNFVIYLAEASLVTLFSGADSSEAYVLYYIFVIGFSAYVSQYRRVWGAGLLCCLGFVLVLLIEWRLSGISEHAGILAVKVVFLLAGTWLSATLSDRLRRIENQSLTRAQELAGSEATLRTILDSVDDALVVYDDSEFIVDANAKACKLFGIDRNQIVGQRLRRFFFDDGTLPQKLAIVRARGVGRGEEMIVDTADEEHMVDVVIRSYMKDDRRYYVAILHDLTEAKNLQEATRQAKDDLADLNEELRLANDVKTRFWAVISRKLRSPLSAVLGNLEMLIEEELGDIGAAQRRALHACRRATLRAFRLIDAVVTFPPLKSENPTDDAEDEPASHERSPHA